MIPKFYELLQPVLELLERQNHKRKTAYNSLLENFHLSDAEKNQKGESGANLFEGRVGWAFTFLTKAEYIELSEEKATYKITDLGKAALEDARKNKKTIDEDYLIENSPNYINNWSFAKTKTPNEKNSTEENLENSDFDLEEELQKNQDEFDLQLLEQIRTLSWQEFEDFCATLLEKMGYGVAAKRKFRVSDGGIDGEILEDELGLKGKIYLQAKKWGPVNKVPAKDMREFLYNIRGKKGVFITTSDFSDDAKDEAKNFKDGHLALINYKELVHLCKKYQHLCEKKLVELYKIKT